MSIPPAPTSSTPSAGRFAAGAEDGEPEAGVLPPPPQLNFTDSTLAADGTPGAHGCYATPEAIPTGVAARGIIAGSDGTGAWADAAEDCVWVLASAPPGRS